MSARRSEASGVGSLDMLLDTMCNTFGGICFIALLIAIISATLPLPVQDREVTEEEREERQETVDESVHKLTEERDLLQTSLQTYRNFSQTTDSQAQELYDQLSSYQTNVVKRQELAQRQKDLQSAIRRQQAENESARRALEKQEAAAEALAVKVAKIENSNKRVVRMPNERSLPGLKSLDLVLRKGVVYKLDDEDEVSREETGRTILFTPIAGKGHRVISAYLSSGSHWRMLMAQVGSNTFVRLYADPESFAELCQIRDDLVRRHLHYNWYPNEEAVLLFSYGYDGRVQ